MKVYVVLRNEDRTVQCLTTAQNLEKHAGSPAYVDEDGDEPLEPILSFKAEGWEEASDYFRYALIGELNRDLGGDEG